MTRKTDKEKAYMGLLALVVIGCTFYLGNTLLTQVVPDANRDIINVALGLILGLSGTVINYYFGSSKGSSDKTDSLAVDDIRLGELARELSILRKERDEKKEKEEN